VFKNSLTTLPMGGGKGGSDFDPRARATMRVMRFCQSFMNELSRHVDATPTCPRRHRRGRPEIGFLFGQYKRLRNEFTGVLHRQGHQLGRLIDPSGSDGLRLACTSRRK
jgi:glutamate dehydrogenase (NADP+)